MYYLEQIYMFITHRSPPFCLHRAKMKLTEHFTVIPF